MHNVSQQDTTVHAHLASSIHIGVVLPVSHGEGLHDCTQLPFLQLLSWWLIFPADARYSPTANASRLHQLRVEHSLEL